ncbi:glycosyltransferase family 87 protein [Puia sp.]|uniref:glycosyltransferase family 87 protein n=1 Tax=Puia sp. TaxID=2045100 RepID=UPI002F3EF422
MPAKIRFLYFLPLLFLFGYGLKHSLSVPPSDFAAYYAGSREIVHGRWANAYHLGPLNAAISADGYSGVFVSYAPFPPFTAFFFAPFLLVSMGAAKIVFNILSCAVFLVTLWRCSRAFSIPPVLILIMPVVFYIPILNNLAFGQAYLILCCLLLEGWLAYREERVVAAALFWGLAILFKLTPGFLFLFLVLRRKWRQAAVLAAVCGILLWVSLSVTGFGAWRIYLSDIVSKMGRGELNDSFTYIFQSAFMLFKRVFLYDGLLNPHPAYFHPYLFVFCMALFKALILAPVILATVRGRDEFFSFGLWIAATLLVSPNGSSYSLILLLIPLWALVPEGRVRVVVALLLLGLAGTIAVSRWGGYPVWLQFPRLYLLLGFFGLLVATAGRLRDAWLAGALVLVFFVLDIRGYTHTREDGQYVLSQEKHLYLYDYAVKDHRLAYFFQDDRGKGEEVTDIPAGRLTEEGLELRNNQIYYRGSPVTASRDWKEKPRLLDGETILYLSDQNRGVGFYTLRKISLSSLGVAGSSR